MLYSILSAFSVSWRLSIIASRVFDALFWKRKKKSRERINHSFSATQRGLIFSAKIPKELTPLMSHSEENVFTCKWTHPSNSNHRYVAKLRVDVARQRMATCDVKSRTNEKCFIPLSKERYFKSFKSLCSSGQINQKINFTSTWWNEVTSDCLATMATKPASSEPWVWYLLPRLINAFYDYLAISKCFKGFNRVWHVSTTKKNQENTKMNNKVYNAATNLEFQN